MTRLANYATKTTFETSELVKLVTALTSHITKLEKKEEKEAPQLLYDLTSLQRHANTMLRSSTLGQEMLISTPATPRTKTSPLVAP